MWRRGFCWPYSSRENAILMSLEDKTARSLGVNVNSQRILISLVAVLLSGISTAVAGAISFLGLIVPHIGRILVGSDHRR